MPFEKDSKLECPVTPKVASPLSGQIQMHGTGYGSLAGDCPLYLDNYRTARWRGGITSRY
jgi:hypothetical protein